MNYLIFILGRRIWRAFQLLAPQAASKLSPYYKNLKMDAPYPFSIALDQDQDSLLEPTDIFRVNRDSYEGTQFSTGEENLAGRLWNM